MSNPALIAHRGGSLEAPENTLAAFRHAISLGIRFVECDVQMSRDGQLVVMHDETLDRTTNGTGYLRDHTFEELRRLDAGAWFGPQFAGERIPSLREVVELCAEEGAGLVVELKAPHINVGIERKVAALIAEMWIQGVDDIWCISFDHEAIRRMYALDPALNLGYLYLPGTDFSRADHIVQAVCPYFGAALEHPEQVDNAHRLGKLVFVWTVNDPAHMLSLARIGVDGIVSDRPSLLLQTFSP
jgi:glycerophosphoryl diester phosphodiesterase